MINTVSGGAGRGRLRRVSEQLDLLVPAATLLIVLIYLLRLAVSTAPPSVPTSYYTPYIIGQIGIVAAVILAMAAWRRRRVGIVVFGALAGTVVLLLQSGALPLDLYTCSEWVRVARERGRFTLW